MDERDQLDRKLKEIWQTDLLGRREEAEFLIKFLVGRSNLQRGYRDPRSYVLNVDAPWGQGKSFFLSKLTEHLRALKYPAVYIDAWQDDFANEPFTAVMSALDNFVQPLLEGRSGKEGAVASTYSALKRNAGAIGIALVSGATKKLAGKLVGDGVDTALELIREDVPLGSDSQTAASPRDRVGALEDAAKGAADAAKGRVEALLDSFAEQQIKRFSETKNSMLDFRGNLSRFLDQLADMEASNMRLPLFVLIDELDRCRPTYAVEMLERIKHLFNVPNVVFVLATNTEQLAHAVGGVYGSTFDGAGYLDRFFDRSYRLATASTEAMVVYLWDTYRVDELAFDWPTGADGVRNYTVDVVNRFGLTLRQLERVMEVFSALTVTWPNNRVKMNPIVLLPMIAMHVLRENLDDINHDQRGLQLRMSNIHGWSIPVEPAGRVNGQARMHVNQYVNGRIRQSARTLQSISDEWQEDRASRGPNIENGDPESRNASRMLNMMLKNEMSAIEGTAPAWMHPSFVSKYVEIIQRAGRLTHAGAPPMPE